MEHKMATFYKVSYEQYYMDMKTAHPELTNNEIAEMYTDLKLPVRSTRGSAGYDFFAPCDIEILPGNHCLLPTGVRCEFEEGWVLLLAPRSGLGFKYGLQLSNTIGVIDSDYAYAKNEGHINCKLVYPRKSGEIIKIPKGKAYMQGFFVPFGITYNDEAEGIRTGGLGSTDHKKDKE